MTRIRPCVLVSTCLVICLGVWLALAIQAKLTSEPYQQSASLSATPATFLDVYRAAYYTISDWKPNTYLHYASWVAPCTDPYGPADRTMFSFISKQRRFLSERTWVAHVWVDTSSQMIEASAADLTRAGPPDSQTWPEQLDLDYEDAIRIAYAAGGDDYMAVHSNCVVRIWLQDDTWRFDFDPSSDEHKEELAIFVHGISGDVKVIRGEQPYP